MKTLDLRLQISGKETLDNETQQRLWTTGLFQPLSHSQQLRLLKHVVPGGAFAAQIQDSAIIITHDWVVSIHGKNILRCVSAMGPLLNSIVKELATAVELDVLTSRDNPRELFDHVLDRQRRIDFCKAVLKWGATIAISALAGAVSQRFLQWLPLGGF